MIRKASRYKSGPDVMRGRKVHGTAKYLREHYGAGTFDNATKFAVVRHPRERFLSACRFLNESPDSSVVRELAETVVYRGFKPLLYRRQVDYLTIDGELVVDKLFRFENDMPDNVYKWLIEQGFDNEHHPKLAHSNRSFRDPGHTVSEDTEKWIKEFYAIDYRTFGYE